MSQARRLLQQECNRYVNGQCTTRACVKRGMDAAGMTFPITDYAMATCGYHEAVQEIDRARDLINCMIDNDPNDYAADAVTVLDVWRKDARDFIASTD